MVILPGAAHRRERLGPNNKHGSVGGDWRQRVVRCPLINANPTEHRRPIRMETSQLHTSLRPVAVKTTLSSIVAAAALLIIASAFAQEHKPDPKFQIYPCFGQSNMEAGARPEEQDRGELDPRFQMLAAVDMPRLDRSKGNWYLATPPLNRQENNMGPVDWFGRNMVANLPQEYRVGVISNPKRCHSWPANWWGSKKMGGAPRSIPTSWPICPMCFPTRTSSLRKDAREPATDCTSQPPAFVNWANGMPFRC